MKRCNKCGKNKPLSDFYVCASRPSGSSYCKECKSLYAKETYDIDKKRIYRSNNKGLINKTKRSIRKRNTEKKLSWLKSYLGTDEIFCDRCKYNRCFRAIHVHHTNPKEKENRHDSLSQWLLQLGVEDFKEKILTTRFIFLCANCHAELHDGVWAI